MLVNIFSISIHTSDSGEIVMGQKSAALKK